MTARSAGRIRELRGARGLSLEKLAQRCGVSRSMLSLIEREESSPTAVVPNKIAASFGVPLAAFCEDASAGGAPISRSRDRGTWRDPQTGCRREVLTPSGVSAPFQLVQVMLPAGTTVQYDGVERARPYHQQI